MWRHHGGQFVHHWECERSAIYCVIFYLCMLQLKIMRFAVPHTLTSNHPWHEVSQITTARTGVIYQFIMIYISVIYPIVFEIMTLNISLVEIATSGLFVFLRLHLLGFAELGLLASLLQQGRLPTSQWVLLIFRLSWFRSVACALASPPADFQWQVRAKGRSSASICFRFDRNVGWLDTRS